MPNPPATPTHLLVDIEGTILPISFVKNTLFPYALASLPSTIAQKWTSPSFSKYKYAFPAEYQVSPSKFISHVQDLTARNVKVAYFKDLQGYLWEEGYESGVYASPFFDDVEPALRRWVEEDGGRISVYSSGSVFAQKLLFGHVENGDGSGVKGTTIDLRPLVTGWFDTSNAGGKMESGSYGKICRELGVAPGEVLFLSDNVKELNAAKEAKLKVGLVVREGNDEVSAEDKKRFEVLYTFEGLQVGKGNIETGKKISAKRQIEDDWEDEDLSRNSSKSQNEVAAANGTGSNVDSATTPSSKKQKTGYVKATIQRASPQRRSKRLQKSPVVPARSEP